MARRWLLLGAASSLLMVVLGAFGAHGLRGLERVQAEPKILEWWETAIRYGSWHALGLVLLSLLAGRHATRCLSVAGWGFVAGELLFSGSLLLMAGLEAGGTPARWLGAVTPFGGAAFMVGWVALFVHGLSLPPESPAPATPTGTAGPGPS